MCLTNDRYEFIKKTKKRQEIVLTIRKEEYEILKLALTPTIDLTYFDAVDVCRTLKGVIERNESSNICKSKS